MLAFSPSYILLELYGVLRTAEGHSASGAGEHVVRHSGERNLEAIERGISEH
jgi:hypothetical protein